MPLAAEFDGQRVISLLMSDDAWLAARSVSKADEQRLLIGYSRLPGFARTSANGLRHFAHRAGYKPDYEWQETVEHLTLKAELVRLIAAAGWQVDTEIPNGPDRAWIADVLAEDNGRRIAFEVQWSPQAADKYIYRQQRYAADGVECVWLVRREPDVSDLDDAQRAQFDTIPIFPLTDPAGFSDMLAKGANPLPPVTLTMATTRHDIALGPKVYALDAMVQAVLDQNMQTQAYINLDIYETACTNCRRGIIMWDLDSPLAGNRERPEESPAVQQYVANTKQLLHINAPVATIAFYRSGTLPDGYKTFICPHCKYPQGAYTEHESKTAAYAHNRAVTLHIPADDAVIAYATRWDLPIYHEVTYREV